jgi:hypothetical protein
MSELTVPLFEAMLLSSVGNTNPDPLAAAAPLSRVDVEALRAAVAKEERTKKQKRKNPREPKPRANKYARAIRAVLCGTARLFFIARNRRFATARCRY